MTCNVQDFVNWSLTNNPQHIANNMAYYGCAEHGETLDNVTMRRRLLNVIGQYGGHETVASILAVPVDPTRSYAEELNGVTGIVGGPQDLERALSVQPTANSQPPAYPDLHLPDFVTRINWKNCANVLATAFFLLGSIYFIQQIFFKK